MKNTTPRIVLICGALAIGCTPRGALDRRADSSKNYVQADGGNTEATVMPEAAQSAPSEWSGSMLIGDYLRTSQQVTKDQDASTKPLSRYVKARCAMELGQHQEAQQAAKGLEHELPELANEILRLQAEVEIALDGEHEQAAKILETQRFRGARAKAAIAWERLGQTEKAVALIGEEIGGRKEPTPEVCSLTQRRGALCEATGDRVGAIRDQRWVAIQCAEPHSETARTWLQDVARQPLGKRDELERARQRAKRGSLDEVRKSLERAEPTETERWGIEAWAMYQSRTRYEEAAKLYDKLLTKKSLDRAELLFSAAKSWSRAGNHTKAIELYDRLWRESKRTHWASRGQFYAARLERLDGRWDQACARLKRLPKTLPKTLRDEAAHEIALCILMTDAKKAIGHYEKLAASAANWVDAAASAYLAALSELRSGGTEGAKTRWKAIQERYPMTVFSVLAQERLRDLGETVNITLRALGANPDSSGTNQTEWVRRLRENGLDHEAERWIETRERQLLGAKSADAEAQCRLYEGLRVGRRLHEVAQASVPMALVNSPPEHNTWWAWNCMYPRPYLDYVTTVAKREGIPTALVFAIMRQESGFKTEATSPVGARGLMQLMPGTAHNVAKEFGESHDPERLTLPFVNIDLGSRYLAKLLRTHGDQLVLAVASYNAGPKAVRNWLGRDVPLDLWIAQIPYSETRNYVWRVLSNYVRYVLLSDGSEEVRIPLKVSEIGQLSDDAY